MSLLHFLILFCCYLLGAIPFGYILTMRFTGLNIMEHGSGNTGSTNVGRIAGRAVATKVQILDMVKGLLPVAILLYLNGLMILQLPEYYIFLAAIFTILGHNFSLFLRFRGGKGVNTTLGATLLLAPVEVFIAVSTYFLVKSQLKFVSASSLALAISLPVTGIFLQRNRMVIVYLLLCCFMIFFRHSSNIKRLLAGQENP